MKLTNWIRRGGTSAHTGHAGARPSQAGKKLALAALVACTALASGAASAQWHHPRVGISFGIGVPYPYSYPYYYYPPPYYYPPAVITVPAPQPPVYVEQEQQPAPQASADWYYCADSRAYYPYVKDCPAGWQRVPAQPAR